VEAWPGGAGPSGVAPSEGPGSAMAGRGFGGEGRGWGAGRETLQVRPQRRPPGAHLPHLVISDSSVLWGSVWSPKFVALTCGRSSCVGEMDGLAPELLLQGGRLGEPGCGRWAGLLSGVSAGGCMLGVGGQGKLFSPALSPGA
jgi:hypothetical protein